MTREDFQVFENGRAIELSNFFAVEGSESAERIEPVVESPPAVVGDSSAPAKPAVADGHVVLFVDNLNIRPENRKRLFASLRRHLRQPLARDTRYMVVSMGRQVDVELPFSSDRERLFEVLDEVERQDSVHAILDAERRMFLNRLQTSVLRRYAPQGSGSDPIGGLDAHGGGLSVFGDPHFDTAIMTARQLANQIRPLSERRYQKVKATIEALTGFCDTLGGVSGRKALVYLSDGLPMRPADSLYEAWTGKHQAWVLANASDMRRNSAFPEAAPFFERVMAQIGSSEFDLTQEFRQLTQRANDNRVVFYPISDSGEESGHVSAAVSGGAVGAGTGSAMSGAEMLESATRDASLQLMAEDTGGLAMTRSANLGELLARVSRDLESFYSLGYRPPADGEEAGKGGRRKLEVRVARDGVVVRYGKGYRPRNWRQQLGSMALASARFETQDNPLNVGIEPLEQTAHGERVRVPILLKVPFEQIRLVHRDDHYVAQLTALLVVQGEDGGVSDTVRVDFPIKIPDQRILETRTQVAGYVIELEVDKGATRIALGVRDHIARVDSTVNVELMAGQAL